MYKNFNKLEVKFLDFRGQADIFKNIPTTEMTLNKIARDLTKEFDNLVLNILYENKITLEEAKEKCLMLGSTKTGWEYLVYDDDEALLGLGPYEVEEKIDKENGACTVKAFRQIKTGEELLDHLELEEGGIIENRN